MHQNAQIVMRGFQAFAEGDMATMKGLFAEDATWHSGGNNRWSGDYTGPDRIVEMMGNISSEAQIENELHATLADDEHVVVLGKGQLSRDGKSFSGNTVFVFHVEDDRVQEVWTIPADPYGLDAFWAD